MWALLHNNSAKRGQMTPFCLVPIGNAADGHGAMLVVSLPRGLCGKSKTVCSFVFFVIIYFVIISFFPCFNELTIAVCSCLGMYVHFFFCTMRCMHRVLSCVQRHLSNKRGCTEFTCTCARLRELFFFLVCVSVRAFV